MENGDVRFDMSLKLLQEQVTACVRCAELAKSRTQTVFADGNPSSSLMLIGEAPGADEDRQGIPFIGRAGKLLTNILMACGLSRDDVYTTNILKCRPPGNRNPLPDEAQNCRSYLDAQIDYVKPKFIICLGAVAAQNLLGTMMPIGQLRGEWHSYKGARVRCTYHPSYLLRAGNKEKGKELKREVWKDLKPLLEELHKNH